MSEQTEPLDAPPELDILDHIAELSRQIIRQYWRMQRQRNLMMQSDQVTGTCCLVSS